MLIKYNNFLLNNIRISHFMVWDFTTLCINNYGSDLIRYDKIGNIITIALNKNYGFLFHSGIYAENWFHLYHNNYYSGIDFEDYEFINDIYNYLELIKNIIYYFNKNKTLIFI